MPSTFNAVLFDLDNTLILFDESKFYAGYLSRIGAVFADLVPPDGFPDNLLKATMALLENDGARSNVDFFLDVLTRAYPNRREALWQRFMQFYRTEYDQLERITWLPEGLQDVFSFLSRTGLKRVLATNPIFPLSVQLKRLAWAGLEHVRFDLVTHIENMTYCKPNLGYYHEICGLIGEPPEACLMVGNDPVNDMVAAQSGMKTYLTTDDKKEGQGALAVSAKLREHITPAIPDPNFTGPLKEVTAAITVLLTRGSGAA